MKFFKPGQIELPADHVKMVKVTHSNFKFTGFSLHILFRQKENFITHKRYQQKKTGSELSLWHNL